MFRKFIANRFLLALILFCLSVSIGFAATPDPALVGRWSLGPNLPYFPVHAHTLPTGKVMIWPGDVGVGGSSGNDPRLWDPGTGAITQLALPGYDLFCSGHSFLADGRLFVTGGHLDYGIGLPNATIYNPFTNTWSAVQNMNAGRWYPTSMTLANGDVLVVSGSIDNTAVNPLPQVFQMSSGTWRDLTSAQLAMYGYPRLHLAPNGKVFDTGFEAISRYLDTSGTGAWTAVANHAVSIFRDAGSSVMYDNGKILVMGGGDPPTKTAEVIDLNAPTPAWRAVAQMAFARRQINATVLPDGKVLVSGGTSGPGFNNTTTPVFAAEMWDPATETWTTMASASIPRLYHSAVVLLPDGRLLSTGGNGYPQAEIYEPPYLFKGARPTITSAPASVSYGQTFSVVTPDTASITQVTWRRLSSVTHAFDSDQRFSRLSFSQVAGGLNVIAPSNANLSPPGHYMLFILNGNGVPSVAKIVQIQESGANPAPNLTSLSPTSTMAGGAALTLTVNGSSFISGSVVRWNGANRTTTFVNSTQLTAAIPASDIASAGTAQVTVFNPAPGGGTSNPLTFTINSSGGGPAGLVLAYAFNEGAGTSTADASGSGNTGTLIGAPTWVAGQFGSSLSFNGSSSYVSTNLTSNLTNWTISGWVRSPAAPGGGVNGPIHREANYQLNWNHDDPTFRGAASVAVGGNWYAASFGPLSANTWYYLAASYDGETLRAYKDGALITSNSAPSGPASSDPNPLTIGKHAAANDFFLGTVDNVRVYNRALSQTEIQNDMNTPVGAASAGTLQFSSATYSVNENGASATITVTRTGGGAGAVGVTFSTSNGTATAGSDYTATTQTVNFAAGDTANKTVNILILDDTLVEGNETVNLTLSSPTGGATLGSPSTAVLTIVDNETANPVPALTTLSPNSATAGGAAFTLTVNGSSFISGSVVRWNGADRSITFVNSTQLTAAIPASDIATAGTAQVTVFNPAPGGGTSNALAFSVNADITPPDTTLTSTPVNPSTTTSASFSFTATEAGTFECQLDGALFAACTSPQSYSGLSQGTHIFQVRAIDASGNVDLTPATYTWTIDSIAPDTTLTSTPNNPSTINSASFSFISSEAGTFQCQLDGSGFSACTSPKSYAGLAPGTHIFQARAIDLANNVDASPANHTWTYTPITAFPGATVIETGTLRGGTAANLTADDNVYYEVNSTTSGTPLATSWYGSFNSVPANLSNLLLTYKGKNSRTCSQTIAIWRWSDSVWVQLDSRNVGTTEVQIANLAPTGTLANYLSVTGELRMRVRCTRNSGTFFASGDLMKIVYDSP